VLIAQDGYSRSSDTCRTWEKDNDMVLVCLPTSRGKKKISVGTFGSSREFVVLFRYHEVGVIKKVKLSLCSTKHSAMKT